MRRTIEHILIVFSLMTQACSDSNRQANPDVIYTYIETHINQNNINPRLYNPPPPPELQDSPGNSDCVTPDSTINKLSTLRVFINPIVDYDSILPLHINEALGEFSFTDEKNSIPGKLDSSQFSVKNSITLITLSRDEFISSYETFRLNEDYGGYVSFHNLYYSENEQKAYFEVSFFKGRLNAATYMVFCSKQKDGTWTFKSELLSIS